MSEIVIGTAGHIDHGKSTLVKALTGIETDTTNEEKNRGMSINLGFAYFDLPNGERVGMVDVPGHEKFIKNMVAGLPGIELILLVVDAGEGIMPQTKEHLDILTLLGIENFIVVLTKIETVDQELKEIVVEEIQEQLAERELTDVPIIETDALAGIGIQELKEMISVYAEKKRIAPTQKSGRLNVDRVFSVKGFGTIVTGTLLDGVFSVGDELTVFPSGRKTKIRNIQIHEENQEEAKPNQRTALNLSNIGVDEIQRGDVLTNHEELTPTWMLDVKIKCLDTVENGISLWDRVRVLIGTREVFARVVPIATEYISPGESGFAQLRLEEEVTVKIGDSFILRSYSPMITIGGGKVLDSAPTKHRRFRQDVIDSLKIKEAGMLDHLIADFLLNQKNKLVSLTDLVNYLNVPEEEILAELETLQKNGEVYSVRNEEWIHTQSLKEIAQQAENYLREYHKKYRLRSGMPSEEFRSKFKKVYSDKQTEILVKLLLEKEWIKKDQQTFALPDFTVTFNAYQQAAKEKIEQHLDKSKYTPVKADELLALDKNAGDVLEALNHQSVTFLTHEYVMLKKWYDEAVRLTEQFIQENQAMTLADFRDFTQSSRKSSMLILEYMDKEKITKRVENTRVLN